MSLDLYEVLQVNPRAPQAVIRAARNALIKQLHPDENSTLHGRRAIGVNEAYATLGDPKKRAEYDRQRELTDGAVIGSYRLLEKIADGGFGKTYKAEHILTGELVCIKQCNKINATYNQVLLEEAKAAWDLRHYSIPVMRDVLQLEDSSMVLVMSYIPGPTLDKIIEKNGRLDAEHVAWIAERLLNALQYMHFHGVLHGDIKPQNIIIQPESHTVVLVDFGLSLVKPTETTAAKGYTDLYAPEEQKLGMPLLPESDFYSLGMTLLYALSGDIGHAARKNVPSDVPDPLCRFIQKLVVRNIHNRPNWEKTDLCEDIQRVRQESFGRTRSDMKPIPGF